MPTNIPQQSLRPIGRSYPFQPQTAPLSCVKRRNVSTACSMCRQRRTKVDNLWSHASLILIETSAPVQRHAWAALQKDFDASIIWTATAGVKRISTSYLHCVKHSFLPWLSCAQRLWMTWSRSSWKFGDWKPIKRESYFLSRRAGRLNPMAIWRE